MNAENEYNTKLQESFTSGLIAHNPSRVSSILNQHFDSLSWSREQRFGVVLGLIRSMCQVDSPIEFFEENTVHLASFFHQLNWTFEEVFCLFRYTIDELYKMKSLNNHLDSSELDISSLNDVDLGLLFSSLMKKKYEDTYSSMSFDYNKINFMMAFFLKG